MTDDSRPPRKPVRGGFAGDRRKPQALQRAQQGESRSNSDGDSRPNYRSDSRSDSRPDSRRDTRSDSRPDSRRDTRSDSRPDYRSDSRSDSRPNYRSDSRPNYSSDSRPNSRPGAGRPRPATPPVRSSANLQIFDCFASCPKGLEPLLLTELQGLGAFDVQAVSGGCNFKAGWPLAVRITYWTRFAGRIGIQVAKGDVRTEDDLYRLALSVDWWNWFDLDRAFRVDLTLLGANFENPRFAQLRLKDGVCDGFTQQFGQRPDVDVANPDVRIFAAATPNQAFIYMDLAGENLFKRGWRLDKGQAPLKENLAAGMWAFARRSPSATNINQFLDPFCGSGTVIIESLSALCDRAPGLDRSFAFEHLKLYDQRLGTALQNDANERFNKGLDQALAQKHFHWRGSDITPLLVEMAHENLCRAGFEDLVTAGLVQLSQRDALTTEPWAPQGIILSNPPYGERVRAKGADIDDEDEAYLRLFKSYGDLLKQKFAGWTVFLLSGDLDIKHSLGLSPKRKTPLFNGAIECRLFEFPLQEGSYRPRSEEPAD